MTICESCNNDSDLDDLVAALLDRLQKQADGSYHLSPLDEPELLDLARALSGRRLRLSGRQINGD